MPRMTLNWPRLFSAVGLVAPLLFSGPLAVGPATAEDEAAPHADSAAIKKLRAQALDQMMAAAADYQLWRATLPLDLKHRGELVWTVDWHNSRDEREPRIVFPPKAGLFKRSDP